MKPISHFFIAASLLLIAALLWLPTGLRVGFYGDAWDSYFYAQFGLRAGELSRPLLFVTGYIAYLLSPGQPVGFNIVMLIMLAAKAWLVYGILRQLKLTPAVAFTAAVLAMLLPVDTGVFYMGASNVYFAAVFELLAIYLLLRYFKTLRLRTLILVWMAQILSLLTYEAGYPLLLIAPILCFLSEKRMSARLRRVLVMWYAFPIILALRFPFIALSSAGFSYQKSIFVLPTLGDLLGSLARIYERHFVTTWTVSDFPYRPDLLPIALGIGVFCGVVCWRLYDRTDMQLYSRYKIGIVSGLIVILMSILFYLPTELRNVSIRLFFISAAGGALSIACIVWWLLPRRVLFTTAIILLTVIASLRLLEQHMWWKELSDRQSLLMIELAQIVPDVQSQTGILIIDDTDTLTDTFGGSWYFNRAVSALYQRADIASSICIPEDLGIACKFTMLGVVIDQAAPAFGWSAGYDRLIILRYNGNFEIEQSISETAINTSLYRPEKRIVDNGHMPSAAYRMFSYSGF